MISVLILFDFFFRISSPFFFLILFGKAQQILASLSCSAFLTIRLGLTSPFCLYAVRQRYIYLVAVSHHGRCQMERTCYLFGQMLCLISRSQSGRNCLVILFMLDLSSLDANTVILIMNQTDVPMVSCLS